METFLRWIHSCHGKGNGSLPLHENRAIGMHGSSDQYYFMPIKLSLLLLCSFIVYRISYTSYILWKQAKVGFTKKNCGFYFHGQYCM